MNRTTLAIAVAVGVMLTGCSGDETGEVGPEPEPEPAVGFEILEIRSPNEIVAWLGLDVSQEEFDAIELPEGWFKNQPREVDPDGGRFLRSPDASVDGEFADAEHYGHMWRHVATIVEANVGLDDDSLLRGNSIRKYHEVTYDAGKTVHVLVSPEGEAFVRVSRDAGRTSDTPTIPSAWQKTEHVPSEDLVIRLPDLTLNIRADNEDSFQGPVSQLEGVLEGG